jgi:peroxiredoxin Q/BCP
MDTLLKKKAPAFTLADQDGKKHPLADYAGKYLLLYFYPKDMTSGCTIEAQLFNEQLPAFKELGVAICGVSPDSVVSHKKFCDKESLDFPLLSDEGHKICDAYGVWKEKSMYGKKYMGVERSTFVIDKKGVVVIEYRKVSPTDHIEAVLSDISNLTSK